MDDDKVENFQNSDNAKNLLQDNGGYEENTLDVRLSNETQFEDKIENSYAQENAASEDNTNKNMTDDPDMSNEQANEESKEGNIEEKEQNDVVADKEAVEEEEAFIEEPPPDPAAPFNFRDSTEALKPPFALRPDQLIEVEQLWELFQAYNPAYTDLDNYITDKELLYMLKSLLLMTYTSEQLQELIDFCVRPPHPEGHISYDQFLKIVTLRQRDLTIEDELRSALQVMDTAKSGVIDREYFKEVLSKQGAKLPQKLLDNLIKEVDISNDGTIGIEDVVGTMCIDLNKDDLQMLRAAVNPEPKESVEAEY